MLRIDIITIFPDMVLPNLKESILKRALQAKKVDIRVHDLRKYTKDKHKKVDDRPFGGGPGMVMNVQPIYDAVKKIKGKRKAHVILASPSGHVFDQKKARDLSKFKNIIMICGHYEGVDDRVTKTVVDESLSIGDYVLTGGELPALVMTDAIVRLVPGVLGKSASLHEESFDNNLLEYPQFTRPEKFLNLSVPKVLLSGNHAKINAWRKEQALVVTKKYRKDLVGG